MTNIIDNMLSLCPVSEDTIQELKKCMILCRFPKKYQLIKENTFCKSAYFIEKGMTRSFWLVNGEEITTSFSWEGGIVFSMDELYYNKPSEEFVETLEDVVVYKISLADLTRLFQTNIELANWGRIIHQNEYRRLHRSHKEWLTLPAKERYEEFKQQFPQICQRVKLRYIASYLGMDELYYNKPSEEFVETLEDVVVYKISLADLTRLFQTNIELANWGRIIHQNEYRRLHRSHKEWLTLPAKERYEEFKQQFPQICQRVKLRYIASYLGITLPTLSRLRAKK